MLLKNFFFFFYDQSAVDTKYHCRGAMKVERFIKLIGPRRAMCGIP